jgi:tryptophan 2,3-dioxygenase
MATDAVEPTYAGYLRLDSVLGAQRPSTDPEQHDEMVFIISHQVTELWFKLILHELTAARAAFRADETGLPNLVRVRRILSHLIDQWQVLHTLTPTAFHRIRPYLGSASGLESAQYRSLETLLGKRHRDRTGQVEPEAMEPSLFDEFIRYLHRRGHKVPVDHVNRDWSRRRHPDPELVRAFKLIDAERGVDYSICAEFVGIDLSLREWRLRHLELVEKLLGGLPGTGRTSGRLYLAAKVDDLYFPELMELHGD